MMVSILTTIRQNSSFLQNFHFESTDRTHQFVCIVSSKTVPEVWRSPRCEVIKILSHVSIVLVTIRCSKITASVSINSSDLMLTKPKRVCRNHGV